MDPTRFDELTKTLATATSRRQALQRIGGTLTGVVLASLLPGRALASPKTCTSFCLSVFGAGTSAARQCITDASQHMGLCYSCGPASAAGTQPICCSQNSSGHCTSYSSATCCTSGLTCQNGQCVTAGCPTDCTKLSNGTCARLCNTAADCTCGSHFCGSELNGGVLAGAVCTVLGNSKGSCMSDSECPIGYYCNGSGNCDQACC